jgi:hypothetical protein
MKSGIAHIAGVSHTAQVTPSRPGHLRREVVTRLRMAGMATAGCCRDDRRVNHVILSIAAMVAIGAVLGALLAVPLVGGVWSLEETGDSAD